MLPPESAYPHSYYVDTASGLENMPRLEGEVRADICIVGAGYTGLSAAYHLAEHGFKVVILEAKRVAWGASGRNAGLIASGYRVNQQSLALRYGIDKARELWSISQDAKALVKGLIDKLDIDCNYQPGILYVSQKRLREKDFESYVNQANKDYGYNALETIPNSDIGNYITCPRYQSALLDRGGAHIHPLNFALGLSAAARAKGVRIYERSRVRERIKGEPAVLKTLTGQVRADHVILACNAHLDGLEKRIQGHIMSINSYLLATEPLEDGIIKSLFPGATAVLENESHFRNYRITQDQRLIFTSGRNRGEVHENAEKLLRPDLKRFLPELKDIKVTHSWGGSLALSKEMMPHVGRLTPNFLFAHGYSGQGIALATMAGKAMADCLKGDKEIFDQLASLKIGKYPGGPLLRSGLFTLNRAPRQF